MLRALKKHTPLYGVYDLLIKIKALTLDKLKEIIKLKHKKYRGRN